jgi:hypothetical protein
MPGNQYQTTDLSSTAKKPGKPINHHEKSFN